MYALSNTVVIRCIAALWPIRSYYRKRIRKKFCTQFATALLVYMMPCIRHIACESTHIILIDCSAFTMNALKFADSSGNFESPKLYHPYARLLLRRFYFKYVNWIMFCLSHTLFYLTPSIYIRFNFSDL